MYRNCIKNKAKWLSPKRRQNASEIWLRNGTKNNNTSSQNASRSFLCIRFVAVAFRSEEEDSWRRGTPPLGGSGRKTTTLCKGPWVLHPYQVSSKSIKRFWRRSWKCESLQTDGRCAMTKAHLSLWLRWAKKLQNLVTLMSSLRFSEHTQILC